MVSLKKIQSKYILVLLVIFIVLLFIVYIPSCFKAIVCRIIYSIDADRYAGILGGEDAMRATVKTPT